MLGSNKNTFNLNHLVLTRPVFIILSLVLTAVMVMTVMIITTQTANAQSCYVNNGAETTCPDGIYSGCWNIPIDLDAEPPMGEPYRIDCPVCYIAGEVVQCPAGTGAGCWNIPASSSGVGEPISITCPPDTTHDIASCPEGMDCSDSYTDPEYAAAHDCNGVAVSIGVDCDDGNPIYSYIIAIINFLSAGVGLVVIIMVAVGGIQYMTAGGNPQATEAAIKRIANALIALVVFIFIWAFLNWLVPGGII